MTKKLATAIAKCVWEAYYDTDISVDVVFLKKDWGVQVYDFVNHVLVNVENCGAFAHVFNVSMRIDVMKVTDSLYIPCIIFH